MKDIVKINSISKLHELMGYSKPKHPLISVVDFSTIKYCGGQKISRTITGFYSVMLKRINSGKFTYGRKDYDFEEATLICMAPEQITIVKGVEDSWAAEGWGLFFHPDLIRRSFLNEKIEEYSFFSYNENEALHLSENENETLLSLLKVIEHEYSINIDTFSKDLIISNIEVLLNYCKRFYGRQFITRSHYNNDIVFQFEQLVSSYIETEETVLNGLPSVKYCADKLNFSPNYLSDLLKQETGKSALEHIHYHLIEYAKNLLLNSSESITEIAFGLGFEQPQNFSKMFKKKVGMSPKEFRIHN